MGVNQRRVPILGLNAGTSWTVAAVCSIAAIALVVRFAEEPDPIDVEANIASPQTAHNWASAAAKSPTAAARLSIAVAALHGRAVVEADSPINAAVHAARAQPNRPFAGKLTTDAAAS